MSTQSPPAEPSVAPWLDSGGQSELRKVHALITRPGILSFALGMPARELFPAQEVAEVVSGLMEGSADSLQYGLPHAGLKRHVVQLMRLRGVECTEAQVFLTSGAQHAMSLLGRALLGPGGSVALEEVSYDGLLMALRPHQPQVLTVPTGPEGIDVDAVARMLEGGARPAFLYLIPEGHNPLGISLGEDKRRRLVELASRFGVPLVEDDAYGLLAYDGEPAPPLRAMDERWVYHVGSFAKILAPSLRVAWMVVPEALVPALSVSKQGADLDVASFSQSIAAGFMDRGWMPGHLERLRAEYRRRRDAMLAALEEHFPDEARWARPAAGMFVWVELPARVDAADLLTEAVEREGVAFIPGQAFCAAGGPGRNCMRLNFSNSAPEVIADGIARLGRVVRDACARGRGAVPVPGLFRTEYRAGG